ncbi:hypothetical protein ACIBKY_37180 [Nonomuraea sp. NPDC050394]|uniref:hypothetical protein n=1 Tax=Nonomuraea sp. NPDC050394 TaxID=3364363 RepID=UPI00378832AB
MGGRGVAAHGDAPPDPRVRPAQRARRFPARSGRRHRGGLTDDSASSRCSNGGELHHRPGTPVRAELGEVITGAKPGRVSAEEIIVFDSTGTAIQDSAAAEALYRAAVAKAVGTRLPLWG